MGIDEFRAEFCLPFPLFYQKHTPDVPMPILEDWYHQHFRTVQNQVTDIEHAREFLAFCAQHSMRMFVLSSIPEEYYAIHTRLNGFGKYIEHAYLAVRDKRHKIHELLAQNALAPDQTLFIGDMQHDIDTAHHGGIHSCGVLTGYNRLEQLRQSHPTLIVEHLGKLLHILNTNNLQLPACPPRAKAPPHHGSNHH